LNIVAAIEADGFAIVPKAVDEQTIDALIWGLERAHGGSLLRNVLRAVPGVRELAMAPPIRSLVEPVLGQNAFAVRGLFFDKTQEANWKVPWHQDLTIAVKERLEVQGFGPWSIKEGVPHVQPPVALLERMLTLRVHLDDCGELNGPLKVLSGSHRTGLLGAEANQAWRRKAEAKPCFVPRGGILVMRPLLLHGSSSAQLPHHRRVIHLEFAAELLPDGLAWWDEAGPMAERRGGSQSP